MTRYFNNENEAFLFALKLKKIEPKYSDNIGISETRNDSYGIWARVDLGRYVVTNEME